MGLALASQFEQCPTGTRLLASLYGVCSGSPLLLSVLGLRTEEAFIKLFYCCQANVLGRRTDNANVIRKWFWNVLELFPVDSCLCSTLLSSCYTSFTCFFNLSKVFGCRESRCCNHHRTLYQFPNEFPKTPLSAGTWLQSSYQLSSGRYRVGKMRWWPSQNCKWQCLFFRCASLSWVPFAFSVGLWQILLAATASFCCCWSSVAGSSRTGTTVISWSSPAAKGHGV